MADILKARLLAGLLAAALAASQPALAAKPVDPKVSSLVTGDAAALGFDPS